MSFVFSDDKLRILYFHLVCAMTQGISGGQGHKFCFWMTNTLKFYFVVIQYILFMQGNDH